MNQYRKDYREAEREAYWTLPRVLVFGVVGMAALGAAVLVARVISLPSAVVTRTLQPDNVITRYEWFYDSFGVFKSRVAQIRHNEKQITDETDAREKSRMRIDLNAIRQSCRDLANKYNANSTKINQGIFRGRDAPEMLNAGECE